MNSNWKIGDKALCVDMKNPYLKNEFPNGLPTEGVIYLISGFSPLGGLQIAGFPVIYPTGDAGGFKNHRFRKVVPACDRNAKEETGLIPHEGFWQSREDLQ